MKNLNLAVLPGDGIGSEIIQEAVKVLERLLKGSQKQIWGHFGYLGPFAAI